VRDLVDVRRVVHPKRQAVLAVPGNVLGQLHLEWRVAAHVAADLLPVEPDSGLVVDRAEVGCHILPLPLERYPERAAVPDHASIVAQGRIGGLPGEWYGKLAVERSVGSAPTVCEAQVVWVQARLPYAVERERLAHLAVQDVGRNGL
jgi:hypothetical protein